MGLLKKAFQLSMLTDSQIFLKIYNKKDGSLIEYQSDKNQNLLLNLEKNSPEVTEYAKFSNDHYDLLIKIDESVSKHGYLQGYSDREQLIDKQL